MPLEIRVNLVYAHYKLQCLFVIFFSFFSKIKYMGTIIIIYYNRELWRFDNEKTIATIALVQ